MLDDIAGRLRDLLGGLERLIQPPPAPKLVRVPVTVPMRPPRRQRPDPYR